jgi:acyl-CoA dehydrogenase
MIEFELTDGQKNMKKMINGLASGLMRKWARWADDNEHKRVDEWVNFMWGALRGMGGGMGSLERKPKPAAEGEKKEKKAGSQNMQLAVMVEELSWGDGGLYLAMPFPGLGGAAVMAAGTPEQKERFLKRFTEGKPKWAAMAITEPGAGSDSAAISTTAVREGDHWVLNGEKIFVTAGKSAVEDSEGFVVVWATVDKSAGRAGIKSFIVEHGTPGMKVTKVEHKLGIRASDTAAIVFEDCKIPLDNILGDPKVKKGFRDVMATFDATRPMVAASAIGVARAALEEVQKQFQAAGIPVRYGVASNNLTAREKDLMMMEAQLKASRLLTWRASWMADAGIHNNMEASAAKAKTGRAVTWITQKAVELLGPLGYSKKLLVEKWMRDAKINDIFEGTGQINTLIVARRLLDYTRAELK